MISAWKSRERLKGTQIGVAVVSIVARGRPAVDNWRKSILGLVFSRNSNEASVTGRRGR